MITQENLDRYKHIFFDAFVVELKMQWVDVREKVFLPEVLHTFIVNPMN